MNEEEILQAEMRIVKARLLHARDIHRDLRDLFEKSQRRVEELESLEWDLLQRVEKQQEQTKNEETE